MGDAVVGVFLLVDVTGIVDLGDVFGILDRERLSIVFRSARGQERATGGA